ncbi:hypothetical protein CDN99_01065 [Roseateles aquatilis]|uniref:Uncharacterized protein n=1 Tax=Roseateles aquatilis TaxID=431061 RepID=A0A246JKL1_9BURK|nr:hypothetical protein [Roseateles aquatilis]OWQ93125.1 hypothetical protein CDN99_01065 [Roseateles aquatilis]
MLPATSGSTTAAPQRGLLTASGDALSPAAQRAAWSASAGEALPTAAAPRAEVSVARPATPLAAHVDAAPLRAAETSSGAREPGAQLQLGRLQQGLEYLDRLAAAMQRLKGGLSDTLARQAAPSPALSGQVDQLRHLWSQRSRDAGGRVDGDLQPAPEDGAARQRFKLRGLDLAVLQQGGRETLRLQLPGQPLESGATTKPIAVAVTLDGEGSQQQLQSLMKALSPAGVTVQAQGQEIVFSVAESQWPALRDGMTLRGEGRRFPSGQPVRALLEPAPEALQPQRWDVKEAAGQRQALGQLLQAQPKVTKARERLSEQLDAAAGRAAPALAPAQAGALAETLSRTLSGAEYSDVGALLPALRGMHRDRVQQLLAG